MRRLAELPPDRAARLADALCARGLAAVAQTAAAKPDGADGDGGPAAEVWVKEEDHLPAAREELAAFLADPEAPRFAAAGRDAAAARKTDAKRRKAAAARTRRGSDVFDAPFYRRAPLCTALAACCLIAAAFGWDPNGEPWILWSKPDPLLKWLYLVPVFFAGGDWRWDEVAGLAATFSSGELWRLVTPIFIHRDPIHLLFNLSWIVTLGAAVEAQFGPWRALALVIASAGFSNVLEYYVDIELYAPALGLFRFGGGNPMGGGMSGVVYALFGFVWGRQKGGDPTYRLPQNTVFLMVGWLFLCMTGALGPIGNAAHAGGLVFGLAVGWGSAARAFRRR